MPVHSHDNCHHTHADTGIKKILKFLEELRLLSIQDLQLVKCKPD